MDATMLLSITDPAIMFSGISLLFLAYTNRYLSLASVVRTLNKELMKDDGKNRIQQIRNLHLRIILIKYMQAFGVLSFLFCVFAMLMLFWQNQMLGVFNRNFNVWSVIKNRIGENKHTRSMG
jgi:hypothetical protein